MFEFTDGYYVLPFNSYTETGPYLNLRAAYEAGLERCWYSCDFWIQKWAGGNLLWRRPAEGVPLELVS